VRSGAPQVVVPGRCQAGAKTNQGFNLIAIDLICVHGTYGFDKVSNRSNEIEIKTRPAAEVFPRLLKSGLDELAANIKLTGLQNPIILHPDGSILDGVHSYKACLIAEVQPRFEIWKGQPGEECRFVLSQNLHRRHLNDRQRSIVAGKIAKLERGKPKQANLSLMTQREAAAALNVTERNARTGRKIVKDAPPNIVALVTADKLSLRAAEAVAKASDDEKARLSEMPDEEAVQAAMELAREQEEADSKEKGGVLFPRLHAFTSQWTKATEPAR
jgi:ParB-like chromosome segregation protein Spo0J